MADYRVMWEEIGLDLEAHDGLLEVLPPLFGDVIVGPEKRPAGMEYFDSFFAEIHGSRIQELVEEQKRGKKVVGACPRGDPYGARGQLRWTLRRGRGRARGGRAVPSSQHLRAHKVKKAVEDSGVPFLYVETDYSQGDAGQIATRVQAFLEMISTKA
jgi:hypothetical protein